VEGHGSAIAVGAEKFNWSEGQLSTGAELLNLPETFLAIFNLPGC
jgi:hypothetical protein